MVSVVREFYAALAREDYAAARAHLADRFLFVGWFATIDRPDEYIEAMKRLRGWVVKIDIRKAFTDGDDLCLFYDAHTIRGVTTPVAAWFTVKDGLISAVRVICDSRPFAELWHGDPATRA